MLVLPCFDVSCRCHDSAANYFTSGAALGVNSPAWASLVVLLELPAINFRHHTILAAVTDTPVTFTTVIDAADRSSSIWCRAMLATNTLNSHKCKFGKCSCCLFCRLDTLSGPSLGKQQHHATHVLLATNFAIWIAGYSAHQCRHYRQLGSMSQEFSCLLDL